MTCFVNVSNQVLSDEKSKLDCCEVQFMHIDLSGLSPGLQLD